jgi:hypothetical protein
MIRLFAITAVLLLLPTFSGLSAEKQPASVDTTGLLLKTLNERRRTVAERVEKLEQTSGDSKGDDGSQKEKDQEISDLHTLDALMAQRQAQLQEHVKLEQDKLQLNHELDSVAKFGLDQPKPYSFLLLESLKDQLAIEKRRTSSLKADIKSSEEQLKSVHTELKEANAEPGIAHHDNLNRPDGLIELDTLKKNIAQTRFELKQADLETHKLRLEVAELRQKVLKAKRDIVQKEVSF